eukprot:jgi/Picsp_1/5530/NSC_02889-R1_histone deacetylase family protein
MPRVWSGMRHFTRTEASAHVRNALKSSFATLRRDSTTVVTIARALHHPVIFHENFAINPIQSGHRFPMGKDVVLYEMLKAEGLAGNTVTPAPADQQALCLAHDPEYVRQFISGGISDEAMKRIGLPWSRDLVKRTLIGVGSAIEAGRAAWENKTVAVMSNGGTHHASYGWSHGCIFNDQAVAARVMQRDYGVKNVLFVDLDVHFGDGTADIFYSDDSVFTFSMHCAEQPFPEIRTASNLDIGLHSGCTDDEYMAQLKPALTQILNTYAFDLVFYNAGVDVHQDDSLGKMSLTDDGILQRDSFVLESCAALGIPVACAIGGGYHHTHLENIVHRHMILHRVAARVVHPMH